MEKNYELINEHDLAVNISIKEGGKLNLNIAQIKEVLKLILDELADLRNTGNELALEYLLDKHSK